MGPISVSRDLVLIIHYHKERWDGGGEPEERHAYRGRDHGAVSRLTISPQKRIFRPTAVPFLLWYPVAHRAWEKMCSAFFYKTHVLSRTEHKTKNKFDDVKERLNRLEKVDFGKIHKSYLIK